MEPNEKETDAASSAASMDGTAAASPASVHLLRPGEVREQTGISHQVLYRYVTLGLVEPAGTTASGQRLYHPSVVPLIRAIQLLTKSGYSLRSLKEIFFKDDRVRRAVTPASPKRPPLNQ